MGSESGTKFCCTCCCLSNTAAAKGLAIMYLVILGICEFVLVIIHNPSLLKTILFNVVLITVTYWFLLSILVVIGTNAKHHRLLLVSAVLGILGILGFAAYLYIYYGYYMCGVRRAECGVHWLLILGCVKLFVSFWYVLCIFGAMIEAKNGSTSGVEMGQPLLPMQQQTGYITVPTISTEHQQGYPTPGSLGAEMGQPIHMQPEYDAPPSYYEIFPPSK